MKYPKMTFVLRPFLFVLFLAITINHSNAQDKTELLSAKQVKLQSEFLNEERTISISLPANYLNSETKYPVLYLLDGRNHIQHANGAVNFLSRQGIIPNLIIVAIYNIERSRDFSPIYHESVPTSGGAEKFINFIEKELMAYMDKNYRVADFKMLLGHSFGGTFVAYSLYERPDLFDAYIAVSPYLHYADNYVIDKTKERQTEINTGNKYFYISVGDEPPYFEPLKKFSAIMEEMKSVHFSYAIMKSENHATTPYLTMFNGLKFVFSDWQLKREMFGKDLAAIDEHYNGVSEKYGIAVQTPENVINMLGYNKLQGNDLNAAIAIFKKNVKRYPKSANVYDSLGEAYENNKQFDLAKENYQKAYKIGTKTLSPNLVVYKENLDRMLNK